MKNDNLSKVKPGNVAIVESICCSGAFKRRLIDMGITPGVEIFVKKVAPLGDPIKISLRGYDLSIRKKDAEFIKIK